MNKNYELAQRVVDWIDEEPDILNMSTFGRANSERGMGLCVAGMATLLSGRGSWIDIDEGDCEYFVLGAIHDDGTLGGVETVAQQLLGLDRPDAVNLFYGLIDREVLDALRLAFDDELVIPEGLQEKLNERYREQVTVTFDAQVQDLIDTVNEHMHAIGVTARNITESFARIAIAAHGVGGNVWSGGEGGGEVLDEAAALAG